MNWLLIPHLGKRNVRGDSNYLLYLDIARYLVSKGDFVHFLVDGLADPSDLPILPGLFYILTPSLRGLSYYNRMALLPQKVIEECCRRSGHRFVDIVLTSRPGIIGSLKLAISAVDDSFVPVMYLEPGAEDRLQRVAGDDYRKGLVQAWDAADVPIFLTQREKQVATTYSRRYLSGTELLALESRMLLNPVGVPTDAVDAVRDTPKSDKFTLFFGARAKEVKSIDQIVKLYDLIYRSGRDVRVVVATPTHERKVVELIGKSRLEGNSSIELHCGLGRADYLKLAASTHVFVAMSRMEGFPVGMWEQMYLGLVGLFLRRPWSEGQLPKDYPFMFSTPEEGYTMLSWVIDHYQDAQSKVAFMQPLIRDQYSKDAVWGNLRDRALSLYEGKQYCMTKSFLADTDKTLAGLPDEFSFEEFIALLSAHSKRLPRGSEIRAEDPKYPGNFDIYRHLLSLGYTYTLRGAGTALHFKKDTQNG